MYKKIVKYEDYDGNSREEECYFNYTKTELTRMNLSADGGLIALMNRIVSEQNGKKLCEMFETIILGAYGRKSLDGRKFEKSDEIREDFKSTLAYDALFMELATDAKKFADFLNSIIPSENKISDEQVNEIIAKAEGK